MDTMLVIAGVVMKTSKKELKVVGVENMEIVVVEEAEVSGEHDLVTKFNESTTATADKIAKMVQTSRGKSVQFRPVAIHTPISHLPRQKRSNSKRKLPREYSLNTIHTTSTTFDEGKWIYGQVEAQIFNARSRR